MNAMSYVQTILLTLTVIITYQSPVLASINTYELYIKNHSNGGIYEKCLHFSDPISRTISSNYIRRSLSNDNINQRMHHKSLIISNTVIVGPINLANSVIPLDVSFINCVFKNKIDFSGTLFKKNVIFYGCKFNGPVILQNTKIIGKCDFSCSVFLNTCNFGHLEVGDDLIFSNAIFCESKYAAQFDTVKTGLSLYMDNVKSYRVIDLDHANIGAILFICGCEFNNHIRLDGSKIGESVWLQNSKIFSLDFRNATINGDLYSSSKTTVINKIILANSKIKGSVYLKNSKLNINSNFRNIRIDGNFNLYSTAFINADKATTNYKIELTDLRDIKCEGVGDFSYASFAGNVSLSGSKFKRIEFSKTIWPKRGHLIELDGMEFEYIRASDDKNESFRYILALANSASYTPDIYTKVSSFYERTGNSDKADIMFIEQKRRERKEVLWPSISWLGSFILDILIRYGKRPSLALCWSTIIVGIGSVVFKKEKMTLQKRNNYKQIYSSFWYSLDLFAPVIDLQVSSIWKPKFDEKYILFYMKIHRILGWVFVPLIIAAITGIIK